ncbi:MAG: hypothetical protein GF418_10830 [Chitinivibrionales bacterium]|nr:hypothetical protein [Chitinivibrionales bacterium]MBD3396109.1 hypothetical protein [Chitinivibrionales bacterium]
METGIQVHPLTSIHQVADAGVFRNRADAERDYCIVNAVGTRFSAAVNDSMICQNSGARIVD